MTALQAYKRQVNRFRRSRLSKLARTGAVALMVQSVWFVYIGNRIADRMGAGHMGRAGWLIALLVAGVGTCGYLLLIYRPVLRELIAADRRLGLRDCLSTAYVYGRDNPEHAFTPLLVEEARHRFEKQSRWLWRMPMNHRPAWIAFYGLVVLLVHVAVAFTPDAVWRQQTIAGKVAVSPQPDMRTDRRPDTLSASENKEAVVPPGSGSARQTADRPYDPPKTADAGGLPGEKALARAGQSHRAASQTTSDASDRVPAEPGALSARLSDVLDARLPENNQTVAFDGVPPGDDVGEADANQENGEDGRRPQEESVDSDALQDGLNNGDRTRRPGDGGDDTDAADDTGDGGQTGSQDSSSEGDDSLHADTGAPGGGQGAGFAPGRRSVAQRDLPSSPDGRVIPDAGAGQRPGGEDASGVRTTARAVTIAGEASRLPEPLAREYRRAFEAALTRGRVPQTYRPYVQHYFINLGLVKETDIESVEP